MLDGHNFGTWTEQLRRERVTHIRIIALVQWHQLLAKHRAFETHHAISVEESNEHRGPSQRPYPGTHTLLFSSQTSRGETKILRIKCYAILQQ